MTDSNCLPCTAVSVTAFSGVSIYFWRQHKSFGRIPALAISGSFATLALYRLYIFYTLQ